MALVALKCPSCNGNVELDDSREFGFCIYCGTKIMVEKKIEGKVSIDQADNIDKWLATCKDAYIEHYYPECYRYAKMVTDTDASNADGWFYRSVSAPDIAEAGFCRNRLAKINGDDRRVQLCDEHIDYLTHGVRGTSMRVDIMLPAEPAKIKGSFRYFAGKFDDYDIGLCRPGDKLTLDTTVGIHHLSFRQVNSSMFGSGSVYLEEDLEIADGDRIVIFADGASLKYNIDKRAIF